MQQLVERATCGLLEHATEQDVARVGVRESLARAADRTLVPSAEVEQVGGSPESVGLGEHELLHRAARGDGTLEVVGDAGGVGEQVVHGRPGRDIRVALGLEEALELVTGEQGADGRLGGEGPRLDGLHDERGGEVLADARDVEPPRALAEPVVDAESRRGHGDLRSPEDAASRGDPREMAIEARAELGCGIHLRESHRHGS